MKTNVKDILRLADRMKSVRQNWESIWNECCYYSIPRKAFITSTKIEGQRLATDVYDSSGVEALQVFAAGLHGYLTNPSAKWFNLRTENRDAMDDKAVKVWVKEAEDKIYDTLNGSNFNQQIHEAYIDFGSIGTCSMYSEEDPLDIVRFYTRPMKEIFIDENARESVDTVYRRFYLTVRQAYQIFGENCSKKTVELYKKGKTDEKVEILHAVFPRREYNPQKKDALNMAWASVYIEIEVEKKLSEGGYKTFPYMVARANKESGELYGTSPVLSCLADIRMANSMAKTNIKAAMKIVDPPLVAPNEGWAGPLNLNPGAVNYRLNTPAPGVDDRAYPFQSGGNIPIGLDLLERVDQKIRRALFVDLFLALQERDPRMTATEVLSREQERMLILGPMLGRLMNELLDPIVVRTFLILRSMGVISPMPEGMAQSGRLVIEYVSPLARAQKASEMKAINATLAIIGQFAPANPAVLDKIDMDKTVDEVADLEGINPELIRSEDEVNEIRGQRAEAQQKAAQIEMIEKGASAADKGASAVKSLREAQEVKATT